MKKIDWNILYPDGKNKIKIKQYRENRDDDQRQLLKLIRKTARIPKSKKHCTSGCTEKTSTARDSRQRATVKMMYGNDKAAHQKFLKEYMSQENKEKVREKPTVFCKYGDIGDYEKRMTGRHYKFILSPESQDVPMEQFVESYMEKVSKELGIRLDWAAAIHMDTAHKHAHILVNGKDIDGRKLDRPFPKEFVKHRAREIARNICTSMVGERTKKEMSMAFERSLASSRWTAHDRKIEEMAGKGNVIMCHAANHDIKKRLDNLVKMGLAKSDGNKYTLEKNWDDTLQNTGRYNSFLSAREALKWTVPGELRLWNGKAGAVSGTVRKTFCLNDEYTNDNALVIENEKEAWFIPLFAPPDRNLEGKNVTLAAKENAKGRMSPVITYDKKLERKPDLNRR